MVNMYVSKAKWIFFCVMCCGECQYLIFSNQKLNWFDAHDRCNYIYDGFLIDEASIQGRVDINSLKKCATDQTYWIGLSSVWSQYIIIDGCYEAIDSFHSDSTYEEDMSIFQCQIQCYYEYGFAIQGKYCKCLLSQHDIDEHKKKGVKDCKFDCLSHHCGFYGGNNTVSIYKKRMPERSDYHPCLYFACIQDKSSAFSVKLQGSTCEGKSDISTYCSKGGEVANMQSWSMATKSCATRNKHLVSNSSNITCRTGLKIWSSERRYKEYYKLRDMKIKNQPYLRCAFGNFTEGTIRFSNICSEYRHFICFTDNEFARDLAACYVNVSRLSSGDEQKREASDDTATIIAVIIGILGCIGMVIIVYFVYRKRRRNHNGIPSQQYKYEATQKPTFKKQSSNTAKLSGDLKKDRVINNESFGYDLVKPTTHAQGDKENLDNARIQNNGSFAYDLPRPTTHAQGEKDNLDSVPIRDNGSFSYDVAKPISAPQGNEKSLGNSGPQINGSFGYDLAKPQVSQYDDIDLETRQSTIDNYAYPHDVSQYEVISPDLENTSEKHRVTKSENDYDHLRQQWDRPKDKDTECEYSPSAADDDDHPYDITKRGITRVDQVEDDYSHMASLKDSNIYDK